MMRILPFVVGLLSTKNRTFLTIIIALLGVVFPFGPDRSFELGVGVPLGLLFVQAIPQSFLADVEPLDGGLIVSEYLIEGAFCPLRALRLHLLVRFGRRPVTFKNMINTVITKDFRHEFRVRSPCVVRHLGRDLLRDQHFLLTASTLRTRPLNQW